MALNTKMIINEASNQGENRRADGLYTDLLDIEKFIRINNLQEVTNPIYLNKNVPTPDGVLSYEIFGSSQESRKQKMAYIDLHGHYMYPIAALKLASYDRTLSKVLYAQGQYRLEKDGTLVQDTENGNSGPEFLYSIWGKVKVKAKDTLTTKEIEKFFQQDRDKLFLTKYPVIPAYYRDINQQSSTSTKSSSILNATYSSIISYVQTMQHYTDTFTNMSRLTQARVQTLLVEIYKELMINTVKGSPSKFGMLRRSLQGKNVNYSARLVISAPVLQRSSYQDIQVKFGYAVLPLAYTLSCFFPFMVHALKRFFDNELLQGGKYPVMNEKGEIVYVTMVDSFDENTITGMITKYINSPSSRFNTILLPEDTNGNRYYLMLTSRTHPENTTIQRKATLTDVLYIIAKDVVKDKHVFVTRYPLDNYNGQFVAKVEVSTTTRTSPMMIGNTLYQFYPIIEGDPSNAFIDTMQFSNTYIMVMGADLTYHVMVRAMVTL